MIRIKQHAIQQIRLVKRASLYIQLAGIALVCTFHLPVHALSITGVSVDNAMFKPDNGETATIRYRIDQAAAVTLNIYDAREWLVKSIASKQQPEGEYTLVWDGTDNAGRPVPGEAYHYTLIAQSAQSAAKDNTGPGETVIYDLTEQTGGAPLAVKELGWEPDKGHIRYHLSEAARVAIRIGLADHGPLLKTVVNWRPRPAGARLEAWDGMDSSNVLDLSRHPKLELAIDAFTLPRNSLLVVSNARKAGFIRQFSWGKSPRQPVQTAKRPTHLLYRQAADKRGDFPLQLSLVGHYPYNDQGIPQVSGEVAFRLDVKDRDLQRIASQRFEPVFYLDGRYVYENEVGYLPMTYRWNSHQYNPGTHFVTANLRGYASNFGMATLKIQVVGAPPAQTDPPTPGRENTP